MSFREEKIKEIQEALQNAPDKLLSAFYALIILSTQFSELPIDLEKAEEEKKEKKAVPVKKEKVAKPSSKPAEMDFDEDLTEDLPRKKKKAVADDFDEELEETHAEEEATTEDGFEDFDISTEEVEESEPEPVKEVKKPVKKEEPAKKEEPKNDFDADFDDFDFD